MSSKNYFTTAFFGLASGISLASGLYCIASGYSAQDSVRDAIYAKAEEITPQVIEQANKVGDKNGISDVFLSMGCFGLAGLCAANGAIEFKKTTEREVIEKEG